MHATRRIRNTGDWKAARMLRAAALLLALCLSGTPSQLANFIRSLENGLYCRFGIYTCGARWKYRCPHHIP